MIGGVELGAAAHESSVSGLLRVGALHLLDVEDVLDLGVRADAVVVAAEVRLPIREEHRLVLGTAERGDREVPPLGDEERENERGERDADPPCEMEVPGAVAREMWPRIADQRVGLGVALGRGVVGAADG